MIHSSINIRQAILALELNETVVLPLDRCEYIYSCRTALQNKTGRKFATRKSKDGVLVFRVS